MEKIANERCKPEKQTNERNETNCIYTQRDGNDLNKIKLCLIGGGGSGDSVFKRIEKAKIILNGRWKLSKQNSYCMGRNGKRFKNPDYSAEQNRMRLEMKKQLDAQGWKCTDQPVALIIVFFGPKMPVDFDNCGILVDAMQGQIVNVGKRRLKSNGIVVVDDRQFRPVIVDWVETPSKNRKIEIDVFTGETIKNREKAHSFILEALNGSPGKWSKKEI